MVKKKAQSWNIGDIFLVQTSDQRYVVGQVVAQEREVLNCVSCAFFDCRVDNEDELKSCSLTPESVFSVLFVTRDLLDRGVWRVIENRPVLIPRQWFPYEHLRRKGYVGAKIEGSAIVNEFLNAFYSLVPWDDWKDPTYLDQLLISPDKKPATLKYKTSQ